MLQKLIAEKVGNLRNLNVLFKKILKIKKKNSKFLIFFKLHKN